MYLTIVAAATFTTARKWSQPRRPSTDNWIMKLRNVHTVGFYLGIKKNEIMNFPGKWADLDRTE